jgi:hypothetical protein
MAAIRSLARLVPPVAAEKEIVMGQKQDLMGLVLTWLPHVRPGGEPEYPPTGVPAGPSVPAEG